MARIDIHKHDIIRCITILAEGNPGACTCLCKLLEYSFHDHFELPVRGVNVLLLLDKYGIYGTDIYVLWKDICDEDYFKVLELLSAVEIGFLDSATLCDACSRQDYSGKNLIDVDQIVHDVKAVLPYFNILETLYKNSIMVTHIEKQNIRCELHQTLNGFMLKVNFNPFENLKFLETMEKHFHIVGAESEHEIRGYNAILFKASDYKQESILEKIQAVLEECFFN